MARCTALARLLDLGGCGVSDADQTEEASEYHARRDLGISHKSALHLSSRIRVALAIGQDPLMLDLVKIDETYAGEVLNRHADQRDEKRGVDDK